MPASWDPREILDCDPSGSFTCVGTTKKGRRCRMSVNSGDLCEASRLLDRMSQRDPRDVRLSELERIAELTLCKRWHRFDPINGQINEVSRQWLMDIREEYPERRIPEPLRQPRSRGAAVETVVVETISVSAHQSRLTTARRPAVALITPPPSPLPSRAYIRSSAPSPSRSRSQTPVPAAIIDSTEQTDLSSPPLTPLLRTVEAPQSPISPITEAPPSPPQTPSTPTPAQQESPIQPEQPSTPQVAEPEHHHPRRRQITDPCPICTSDICCEDDAVWCRAQCGQSIHRSCFAAWRRECLDRAEHDRRVGVTCVYCRATWKWEWEE